MKLTTLAYVMKEAQALLSIDSPTGYTKTVTEYVMIALERLGYSPVRTVKGGVFVDLGGGDTSGTGAQPLTEADAASGAVLLEAHVDTLGGMVKEIKGNGRLRISPLGGLNPNNVEAEDCYIITRSGDYYDGTIQLANASIHVNTEYNDTKRTFDTLEVVIDQDVNSKEDVKKLGISVGDIVCPFPRTKITSSGYIKSRFLDDKLSTAILLGLAYKIKLNEIVPKRRLYLHITVFEEVGHGGSASIPADVTEIISVDMGCVGDGLECTERQVSICAKDSRGPYHYEVVSALIDAAKRADADYAVDIYPAYGSDADTALISGHDIRHGLIGPGVYASHGYERSHVDGVENTLKVLEEYLLK
ncbi:MAG: M42 family metallopeptidase [Lachnospiraceae bacterium]|nr:M42 family metallopeptidase [Lachnospiraceae bacterium]